MIPRGERCPFRVPEIGTTLEPTEQTTQKGNGKTPTRKIKTSQRKVEKRWDERISSFVLAVITRGI
jgi:hypothetical protein